MSDEIHTPSSAEQFSEKLAYNGSGIDLAIIMFKNLVLTILTLGIYWAWGRTNMRRYLWGNVSFLGDRSAYTGTGKELFRGWAMVGVFYVVIVILINVLTRVNQLLALLILPGYIYLYALAIYGGTRYRLSRTTWRETTFGVLRNKESSKVFILLCFKGTLLTGLTLGFYSPIFQNEKRKFLTNRSHFGSLKFNFTGKNKAYFWLVMKGVLFTVLTLGIYTPWMMISLLKYRLEHTNMDEKVFFKSDLSGKDLFVFSLIAYLGTILTLGLAIPWVINKSYKLFINSVTIFGSVDFNSIVNVESQGNAVEEAAVIEYDLDMGF